MKLMVLGVISALGATPLGAQQVSVATGDWSNIPVVQSRGAYRISPRAVDDIAAGASNHQCPAIGNERHLSMSVPFLVEFTAAGAVNQVVVRNLGCPKVESALGGAILQLAKSGEYKPTGVNIVGWYRGQFELSAD